jgi:hypothetical protein
MLTQRSLSVFACSLGLSLGCSRPTDRIQSPTDGSCPILIHKGPLETCADMPWKVLAEIRINNTPTATESVSMLDEAGRAAPFDCGAPAN